MFDDLFDELNNLPFEEQQLFLKMNQLILRVYSSKTNSVGREGAIEMLKGVLGNIHNSIDDDNKKTK